MKKYWEYKISSIPKWYIPIDLCIPKWYTVLMKISINLPEELLKDMDKVCLDEKYERSEFIRTAIRDRIYPKDIQGETMGEKLDKLQGKETPTNYVPYDELGRSIPAAKLPSTVIGFCQGPLFEKGVKQKTTLITWEDENGNPMIKEKYYCDKCLSSVANRGVGHLYYL